MASMEEQRKSHKGLWVIGAVVVILLFCAFFFRVKKVSIEGNTYYSSREMEAITKEVFGC